MHFGRSAATQAAEEAAELAALGPATSGPPKRARESEAQKLRRRRRRRLKDRLRLESDASDQVREDAARRAFVGRGHPPYWNGALELYWASRHEFS